MTTRRNFSSALGGAAALASLGLPLSARAQATPEFARILVGFPAGGTTDALSRRIADKLRGQYATNVMVENKPGAGGQIAITALKDGPADGSTLLLTPSSMLSIYPFTYPRLPYRLEDLAPVSVPFLQPLARASAWRRATAKSLKDFLAWTKANPDKANYGSPAAGRYAPSGRRATASSLAPILKHIPYRSCQGFRICWAGRYRPCRPPWANFGPTSRPGNCACWRYRETRNPFAPDVSTYREQGYPLTMREWYGFFLPSRASAQTVCRAAAYLLLALGQPDVISSLAQVGMEVQSSSPEQLADADKVMPRNGAA